MYMYGKYCTVLFFNKYVYAPLDIDSTCYCYFPDVLKIYSYLVHVLTLLEIQGIFYYYL